MGLANIAATNMEHLCNCQHHGYSQSERWGNSSLGSCSVECEGHISTFYKGDRDCSSAVIDSWREALIGTPYEGALDAATYTGNMRSVFVGSGLFTWEPMSYTAKRGDIYLNEGDHTAMCTNDSPDLLSEFSLSETGGIYGQSGDQTGSESSVHGYYNYPWNGILHYNGKADGSSGSTVSHATTVEEPEYQIFTREHGWLDVMRGLTDTGGGGDDYAGVEGCWAYDFKAWNLGANGWYEIERADGSKTRNSSGNTDSPITGIIVYYDTDTTKTGGVYYAARYQAHWQGDNPSWGDWETDDIDTGQGAGAGKDANSPIDMFRLTLELC